MPDSVIKALFPHTKRNRKQRYLFAVIFWIVAGAFIILVMSSLIWYMYQKATR